MLTLLAVSGMRVWHPVSIRLKENAFCLFFTPTPFPLVKWMKLTPWLYCLRPRKVNGTARAETDKCPCDAVQGNQATKAVCEEGWALQRARLGHAQGMGASPGTHWTAWHWSHVMLVLSHNSPLGALFHHPNLVNHLCLRLYLLTGGGSSSV